MCYRIVKNEHFETVILALIILSSLKLVFDTYIKETNPNYELLSTISNKMDIFFTVLFALESAIKAISFGFIINK